VRNGYIVVLRSAGTEYREVHESWDNAVNVIEEWFKEHSDEG